MKHKVRFKILVAFLALLLLLQASSQSASPAIAQSGGSYDLTWNTIDGGGAMFSTGGAYSLGGTIGQPDAGTLSGGAYTLAGGFWNGSNINISRLFLPMIAK